MTFPYGGKILNVFLPSKQCHDLLLSYWYILYKLTRLLTVSSISQNEGMTIEQAKRITLYITRSSKP